MISKNAIFIIACIFGMTAVIFGAFGAHYFETRLDPDMLDVYETGVRYQFYHTILLLFCGLYYRMKPKRFLQVASILAIAGVILFSGSIYVISTSELSGLDPRYFGPVTPVGGLFLIAAWAALLIGYVDLLIKKSKND